MSTSPELLASPAASETPVARPGKWKESLPGLARHGFLIVFTGLTLWPVMWVLKMAFEPGQDFAFSISPIPSTISFENFARLIGKTDNAGNWVFARQALNSFVIALSSSLLGILFAATAAYAFSRFKFPGRRAGLLAFLATQMFPGTMMMIPLYLLLNYLGLLDTRLGLVLVYSTTSVPFSVWMLKGYFDTIPKELEEAALIDGASQTRIFWQIVLPLSAPAIAVTFLFSFMSAWNEYILAAKFMDSELHYTLPVVVNSAIDAKSVRWGDFAAGAVFVSAPIVALFLALQRYIVGGLTAGGVKG
ncbi:MAG TPA: ABC transporter [Myxococcales bacterium]|jgi:arabinogalactan oligomer/maltooligosaccharide transport system permease protein|nr:ABC transporter [Myxococcales bacterium]